MRLKNTGTDTFTGIAVGSVFVGDIGERSHKVHGPQYMLPNRNWGSKSTVLMATLVPPAGQQYTIGADGFIRLTIIATGALVDYYRITPVNVKAGYTAYLLPKYVWDAVKGYWLNLWKPTNIGQARYFPVNVVVEIDDTGDVLRSRNAGQIKEFIDRGILQIVT